MLKSTTNDKLTISTVSKCPCDDIWDSDMYEDYKKCKKTTHSSSCSCHKPSDCSCDNSFAPICKNAICTVPRMHNTTVILQGKGRISDSEPEEPETPEVPEVPEEENGGDIDFNLSIGKKFSKYVGEICLVDYDNKVFITSKDLKCFIKSDCHKAVAIFTVENFNGSTKEIVVFITTPICGIPASLFVYAPPICGEEALSLGGSVTEGTIEFLAAKEDEH